MKKVQVFIDESGTLPDPKDKFIVLAAVTTSNPEKLNKIIAKVRKTSKLKRKSGEIKYYTASDKMKRTFSEAFSKEDFGVFVLIIDKMGRKITDTPENFALLSYLLISDVLLFHDSINLIFDRHFFRKSDEDEFNKTLLNLLDAKYPIEHVDSMKNKKVNASDMVAGAVLANETRKNSKFYEMTENRIISSKKLNWKEAKARLF